MILIKGIRLTVAIVVVLAFQVQARVESVALDDAGFIGNYYPSSDASKKPVLVLGGSEGGLPTKLAEGVAALGYPTLAVAYFDQDKLPGELEKIPLGYFENATTWLLDRHGEANDHIALVGWSKGAELALLLAARDTTFNHVVAIAPSAVVWAGILKDWQKVPASSWVEEDNEIPYVPFNPTGPITGLLDLYTQSLDNRQDNGAASIPVENIKGQVDLFSGGKDEIWPSSVMAETICKEMEKNDASDCTHVEYAEMGHLLDYKFLDKSSPLHQRFAASLEGQH